MNHIVSPQDNNGGSVLVTGGCGFIGSHVVLQLSEAGYHVIVVDDFSTGFLDSLLHNEKVYCGNCGDRELLSKIFTENQISSIFHFAGVTSVPESIVNPIRYYEQNVTNSLHLLEAATKYEVENFLFSSTAAVYTDPVHSFVSEDSPTSPKSPYGASKLMIERMLSDIAIAHSKLHYVILRYFNVAGAEINLRLGQRTKCASHLIQVACDAALNKRPYVELFGTDYPTPDGTGVRDYIHIQDLAHAHVLALQYLTEGGNSTILNVGYEKGTSAREVVEMVKKISGREFNVIACPRRLGDASCIVAKVDKITSLLNWQPQYNTIERIIEDTWKWSLKKETI